MEAQPRGKKRIARAHRTMGKVRQARSAESTTRTRRKPGNSGQRNTAEREGERASSHLEQPDTGAETGQQEVSPVNQGRTPAGIG